MSESVTTARTAQKPRRTLTRAGLNQYLYEHTNIREQDSWVVTDKELATQKAIRLVRAAVARLPHLVPLQKRVIPIHPSVLVIGGGIQGRTETTTLYIFRALEERQYSAAYSAALVIGLCTVVLVTVADWLRHRSAADQQ